MLEVATWNVHSIFWIASVRLSCIANRKPYRYDADFESPFRKDLSAIALATYVQGEKTISEQQLICVLD